jgi:uncharacterized protein YkwD
MRLGRSGYALVALGYFAGAGIVAAQSSGELVDLINAYRAAPQTCDGNRSAPAPPLNPNAALASVEIRAGTRMLDALKARGYPAARAHVITVSGPTTQSSVMQFIAQRYCGPLTSAQYVDIGVAHNASDWNIVLASPVLTANLGDWRTAGSEILRLTNAARAAGRSCGTRGFPSAPAVAWNDQLASAALRHSVEMAERSDLRHLGKGGTQPGDRAASEGYRWQEIGENIAGGQSSPEQVVTAWLASPVHCANLMNGRFAEMGAAFAVSTKSAATIYWTQVFGTTR